MTVLEQDFDQPLVEVSFTGLLVLQVTWKSLLVRENCQVSLFLSCLGLLSFLVVFLFHIEDFFNLILVFYGFVCVLFFFNWSSAPASFVYVVLSPIQSYSDYLWEITNACQIVRCPEVSIRRNSIALYLKIPNLFYFNFSLAFYM